MKKLWLKFIGLFTMTFEVFEENHQINLIQSIGKDSNGFSTVEVKPIGADHSFILFPYQIMNQNLIKKQFLPTDIKLIKALLIAEGDIFIESKEYHGNDEIYFLQSVLDQEKWTLTRTQIETQKNIFNRINKRFFNTSLNQTFLTI